MNILLLHSNYAERGGEDVMFEAERDMLTRRGHVVETLTFSNAEMAREPLLSSAVKTIWNGKATARVRAKLREHKFDIVHVHNTFPSASPAIIRAASAQNVPVVVTLHNYRLLCVNALLSREGTPCERCVGLPLAIHGVRLRCFRGSAAASAVVAATTGWHRAIGTYSRYTAALITLTEFAKSRFVASGFDERNVHVKANGVPDVLGPHGLSDVDASQDFVFVGRLSEEKGLFVLIEAWRQFVLRSGETAARLRIVGDGPLRAHVERATADMPTVEVLGALPRRDSLELVRRARCLVLPSLVYEGLPTTIVEAFSLGIPVIASGNANLSRIVEDGRTGFMFEPGSAHALCAALEKSLSVKVAPMGGAARLEYEARYSEERSYETLMAIYKVAAGRY